MSHYLGRAVPDKQYGNIIILPLISGGALFRLNRTVISPINLWDWICKLKIFSWCNSIEPCYHFNDAKSKEWSLLEALSEFWETLEIGLEKSTTLTFIYYGIYPSISRPYTFGRLGGGFGVNLWTPIRWGSVVWISALFYFIFYP